MLISNTAVDPSARRFSGVICSLNKADGIENTSPRESLATLNRLRLDFNDPESCWSLDSWPWSLLKPDALKPWMLQCYANAKQSNLQKVCHKHLRKTASCDGHTLSLSRSCFWSFCCLQSFVDLRLFLRFTQQTRIGIYYLPNEKNSFRVQSSVPSIQAQAKHNIIIILGQVQNVWSSNCLCTKGSKVPGRSAMQFLASFPDSELSKLLCENLLTFPANITDPERLQQCTDPRRWSPASVQISKCWR